jgi:hypothetical protein
MMQPDALEFRPPAPAEVTIDRPELAMLAGVALAGLILFSLTLGALQPPPAVPRSETVHENYRSPEFQIDRELAALLFRPPEYTEISEAVAESTEMSPAATGQPLDLLAQVASASAEPPVTEVDADRRREEMIVAANAERRAVRLALQQLTAHATATADGFADGALVMPLIRRAERSMAALDTYGDSLLLVDSDEMRAMTYRAFESNRAAALRDIAAAEAILSATS